MSKLIESTLSSEIIFQGKVLDLRLDEVTLPNGKIGLIKQFRYAIKEQVIELPAGKLDKDEKPEDCAKRELEEEIGYFANKLTFLTIIHPAIGFANEKMWIYLAEDLEQTKSKLDKDEFLQLIPTKIEDAIELIWNGTISDVKTIIGLLWTKRIFSLE